VKLAPGLTVYSDGPGPDRSYLVAATLDDAFAWARLWHADRRGLSHPVMVGSVANHMPYSDWRPVAKAEIPPRLLEALESIDVAAGDGRGPG
jgi:hypothetical protein